MLKKRYLPMALGVLLATGVFAGDEPVQQPAPMVLAQATTTPPPVVVVEDRSLRERVRERDITLAEDLALSTTVGDIVLPAGTVIGRERLETRFAAPDQPIRQRADLRDFTLTEDLTITDPATGEPITFEAGTQILRLRTDQRLDADGNVLRSRIDLRVLQPDGTVLRIRDRAPEVEAAEVEIEDGVAQPDRSRGGERSDTARSGRAGRSGGDLASNSGRGSRLERASVDRIDRVDRSGSGDRPERVERVERVDRSGSSDRPERVERSGSNSGRH